MEEMNKAKYMYDKVSKILDDIENLDPAIGDIFESIGILLHDVLEMCGENARKDKKYFIEQRADCRRTIKQIKKQIDNCNYLDLKY